MNIRQIAKLIIPLLGSAVLFSGCGNKNEAANQEEYQKVVFATWTINTVPTEDAIEEVEAAINAITMERDHIQVDLRLYPYSDYFQQISLALQSGEQIDVFTTYGNFSTALSTDMCYDITDLIDEYAPHAKEKVGSQWLQATESEGRIYGIPAWMPAAVASNIVYRQDIAEELGIDMTQITSVEELTSVFEQVKAAYPNMYPLCGGAGVNGGMSGLTVCIPEVDYLGDDMYSPAGVLIGDSMEVVDLFETEEYADMVTLARQWHEDGLMMQDLATTTLSNIEILSGGNSFANITLQGSAPETVANSTSSQTNQQMDSLYIGNSYIDTSAVNTNTWCISATSKVPEAALKFLDLTYYDEDIINLIVYGIEGRDYVVQEDGSITTPDGMDGSSVPYPGFYILSGSWSMGDMHRMEGTTEASIQFNIETNKNSKVSPALGFTFDNSSVKTEYTAVNNVIKQYYAALDCGSVDPETELPNFIKALKDAGIDSIIAEKQKQLDAWAAEQ